MLNLALYYLNNFSLFKTKIYLLIEFVERKCLISPDLDGVLQCVLGLVICFEFFLFSEVKLDGSKTINSSVKCPSFYHWQEN